MSIWDGIFTPPIYKHRLYTGDILNHFEVKSIRELVEDEEQEVLDQFDEAESEMIEVGDGDYSWLVEIGFIGSDTTYEYIVKSDEAPTYEEAKQVIKDILTHQ